MIDQIRQNEAWRHFRERTRSAGRTTLSVEQHDAVIDAIRHFHPAAAEAAMREHLISLRSALIEAMQAAGSPTAGLDASIGLQIPNQKSSITEGNEMNSVKKLLLAATIWFRPLRLSPPIFVSVCRTTPTSSIPHRARTFVGRIVFTSLCDKLFDINEKLEIQPQLAKEWTWSRRRQNADRQAARRRQVP